AASPPHHIFHPRSGLLSTPFMSCALLSSMCGRGAVGGSYVCPPPAASPAIRHRGQAPGDCYPSVAAWASGVASPCRRRSPHRLVELKGQAGRTRVYSPPSTAYTCFSLRLPSAAET